jgi:hypothetical protein
MTDPTPERRVSIRQIADLLAWARRLAEQPLDSDRRERAAFYEAKTNLLARLNHPDNHPDPEHTAQGGGA